MRRKKVRLKNTQAAVRLPRILYSPMEILITHMIKVARKHIKHRQSRKPNVVHTLSGAEGFSCFSTDTMWYSDSWVIFMSMV